MGTIRRAQRQGSRVSRLCVVGGSKPPASATRLLNRCSATTSEGAEILRLSYIVCLCASLVKLCLGPSYIARLRLPARANGLWWAVSYVVLRSRRVLRNSV